MSIELEVESAMASVFKPSFTPSETPEAPQIQSLIAALHLEPHSNQPFSLCHFLGPTILGLRNRFLSSSIFIL